VLLTIHVLLACIVLGGLVAILWLLAGTGTASPLPRIGRYVAAFEIADDLVTSAAIGFVFTGLGFSLLTHWGFVRFSWVTLKWIGALALGALLVFAVNPLLAELAGNASARREPWLTTPAAASALSDAILAAALAATLVVLLVALSVWKPGKPRDVGPLSTARWPAVFALAGALAACAALYAQHQILERFRHVAVVDVPLRSLADGEYHGSATVGGFNYQTDTTLADGRITRVLIRRNRDSRYARLAAAVTDSLIREQSTCVDWVSGASTTSRALQRAVSEGFVAAGGQAAMNWRRCR
jgi:uncharacterized protein with FMN-binding domain